MSDENAKQIRDTAIHEAGHALMTLLCNRDASVRLCEPSEDKLGECRPEGYLPPLEAVLVDLAGPVAEVLYGEMPSWCDASELADELEGHDFMQWWALKQDPNVKFDDHADVPRALRTAERFVALVGLPTDDSSGLCVELMDQAVAYFRRPHVHRALRRIAEALVSKGSLTADEVRALARCERWRSPVHDMVHVDTVQRADELLKNRFEAQAA